jgi:hypothetical protein
MSVTKIITAAEVAGYQLRLDALGALMVTACSPRSPAIDEMLRLNEGEVTEQLRYEREVVRRWRDRPFPW